MPSLAPAQMTFSFEPALPDRFPTLRHYVAHRAAMSQKHMKVQAADMDMAPSTLARKLNPADGDTQRLNCDDLESWLASTGEAAAVIEYLAAKYMDDPAAKKTRLLNHVESLVPELLKAIASLRESAA